VRSGFSGGARTGFGSGLDSTCKAPLSGDHAGLMGVEAPGTKREEVEPLHAPKPPDDGVMGEADEVGVPNDVWPKVDVDPNAGCPKAGVIFVPKPVCPNAEAGFRASFCESGEGVSSLAWFQFENAPNPVLMIEEPKADVVGVEEGWVIVVSNKPPWPFS